LQRAKIMNVLGGSLQAPPTEQEDTFLADVLTTGEGPAEEQTQQQSDGATEKVEAPGKRQEATVADHQLQNLTPAILGGLDIVGGLQAVPDPPRRGPGRTVKKRKERS
jgi:hypothetical protein